MKWIAAILRDEEYVEAFNKWMRHLHDGLTAIDRRIHAMALDLSALKASSDRAVAKIIELETKVTALTAQLADPSGEAAAQAEINAIAANLATAAPEVAPPAPEVAPPAPAP
jgi:chromosome segregation ATPase